jgi:hypothetical protein
MRKLTLIVRDQNAPYFLEHLTAQEKLRDQLANEGTLQHLKALGFNAVSFGNTFVNDDFHDRCHLTASGGEKMAHLLAPLLLDMGHRLYGIDPSPSPLDNR